VTPFSALRTPSSYIVSMPPRTASALSSVAVACFMISVRIPSVIGIKPDIQLGIYPFPGPTAAMTRATVGLADGIAINASSPHIAEAKKFLNFVAREGQSRIWPNILRGISLADANTGKVPKEAISFKPYLQAKKTVSLANLLFPNGNVYIQMGTQAQGLLTGQTTVDDVLKGLDTNWG